MKKILSLTITLLIMLQMVFSCNLVFATDGAPKVVSITPSGDNVTSASAIVVEFDRPMWSGRLTEGYIVVRDKTNSYEVATYTEKWVYENKYVFLCELLPNRTYELEVNENVESAERVKMGEKYLHTFSTGETLSTVKEITPTNEESYIHNYTVGTAANLYDNNVSTQLQVNGGVAGDMQDYSYIIVDLGKTERLAYVKFTTGNSTTYSPNIHVEASNDINFADDTTVELAVTPATALANTTWAASTGTDTPYQYIRFKKSNTNHCRIAEIDVYAYEGGEEVDSDVIESVTSPEQISKTEEYTVNSYELRGSLTAGGEVTFSSDITVNGDYVMPKLYAAVYTETEAGAKQIVSVNVSVDGEGTVTVTVPEDAENATVKFFIMTEEQIPLVAGVEKNID